MKITIGAPNNLYVVSNGNQINKYELSDNFTASEWFVSYPIVNYGISFYLGDFTNFSEKHKNKNGSYNIDYYVLKKNQVLAKEYYKKTSDIIETLEGLFGEYPFANDGIGLVESPYRGMEHQSAIAIGDDYSNPKYRGYDNYGYNFLLIHELAHEWWGNAVSIDDMADAWINEGFATYAEALFVEKKFDYSEYQKVIQVNSRKINNIIPLVGLRNVNDNTFFTGDIYSKGAALLHNLRCIVNNDSLFFTILSDFYQSHLFATCNTKDFVELVKSKTTKNLTPFFNKFLYDNRLPILEYHSKRKADGITVFYKWTEVENGFEMPISILPNNSDPIKLNATTNYQSIFLDSATFFMINNISVYKGGNQKNSLTYFWTNYLPAKQLFE
jgi:aminopeptidase N